MAFSFFLHLIAFVLNYKENDKSAFNCSTVFLYKLPFFIFIVKR